MGANKEGENEGRLMKCDQILISYLEIPFNFFPQL